MRRRLRLPRTSASAAGRSDVAGSTGEWRERRRSARWIGWGPTSTPTELVGTLRIGERQVVEIARALSGNARCLILDEPTAALSAGESDRLFEIIRRLRAAGVAIIYITHRLDEVQQIADRVQVLRDGETVLEGAVTDHGRDAMVEAMVGRRVDSTQRPETTSQERKLTRSSGFAICRPSARSPMSTSSCVPERSSPSTAGSVRGRKRSPRRSTAFAILTRGRSRWEDRWLPMRARQGHPGRRRTPSWRSSARRRVHEPAGRRESLRGELAHDVEARRHHRQA